MPILTGVDPKSIVCEFFRHGQCTKGFKCKFSHDLNVERKTAKIDLYSDRRGGEEGEGGMEDWDQETLEKVGQHTSDPFSSGLVPRFEAAGDGVMYSLTHNDKNSMARMLGQS